MSAAPTPETDAAEHELHHTYVGGYMRHCRDGGWVESELARRLERERDEACRELESLRRDKARLDWLESNRPNIDHIATPTTGLWLSVSSSFRAAIDAAMKEGTP